VLATILWSLALTAVFAPFALRAYARRTVAKAVLEPRLETCPGLGQVAQGERDACRADRVDGLRVAVLEMSWVTGQTVFADGGLALHSPIDAYGQVQRVIARRQAGSAER